MKRVTALLSALALMLALCACTAARSTWQKQYDLGAQYLSGGNWQEAIQAFTAAIETDPGRAEAYLGLADACEALGDVERARQVLEDALAAVSDPEGIQSRLDGLGGSTNTPTPGITSKPTPISSADFTIENGVLVQYNGSGGAVTIPDGVTGIGDYAFYGCDSLTDVTIPDSVTSIGNNAFRECGSLTAVTMPGSVTSVGKWAFGFCDRLANVTISDSLTGIEDYAFAECGSLTDVTIPESVTSIGFRAFAGCNSLTVVTIPESVTDISECAFGYCTDLTDIKVAGGNSAYSSVDGVLFNADQTLLHTYPAGKGGSYSIPESVTAIGDWAFGVNNNLTRVTIPDSVAAIGVRAFGYCNNMENVYYGGSEAQWNQVAVDEDNYSLHNAAIHFDS